MKTVTVVGYKGLYTVREDGYIHSLKRFACKGGPVRQWVSKLGYPVVYLCRGNKAKTVKVHRIVAMAFIPNPSNKPQVNHKDGDKLNYSIPNLEWVTAKENIRHAHENGLTFHKRGHEAVHSKLTEKQRNDIVEMYAVKNVSQVDISKKYKVTQGLISLVVKEFIRRTLSESGLSIDKTKTKSQ